MEISVVSLISLVLLLPNAFGHKESVAHTPRGRILGSTLTSRLGKTIYSFRGIRYAKAPINNLRFQPPQPPDEWRGSYNATQDAPICPQTLLLLGPSDEDCLFLNVYTTKLPSKTLNPKRPVIVFLHPGGFVALTGRSSWAGPEYLLDEDIVLVTLNYRLGILGFISTGSKEAPGNLGFKDQVQALKWVKENIIYFGGDPECVTVFGYSAGSTSVILHMVSPMSKGLFHRAISGSASPFKGPLPTNLLDAVQKTATEVDCPDAPTSEMVNCLKTVPADVLGRSGAALLEFGDNPIASWGLVVEPDFGQERFLIDDPTKLILKGEFENIPFMTGITKDEFSNGAFSLVANQTLLEELDKNFEKYAPIVFLYERNSEKSRTISRTIRKFYLGDGPLDNSSVTGLAQLYADSVTGFPINRAAKLFASKNCKPVYYYQFSYQGRYSYFYLPGTDNVPYGVVHHDDLMYLFYISPSFPMFNMSDPESRTVDKMIKMWADFARTGNPTPEPTPLLNNVSWEPFTPQNNKYMDIGDELQMKTGMYAKRYQVWDNIYPIPSVAQD